ncbi:hypothetical protein PGB90_003728 [Kerria lacca]
MFFIKRVILNNNLKRNIFKSSKDSSETTDEAKKSSIFQKWTTFWKLLFNDYRDVIIDISKHAKEHPVKTSVWFSIFGSTATCCALNPDELQYRENIIQKSNELIFVGKQIRNPAADEYLQTIEWYYNQGLVKRINFGVFCLILCNFKNEKSGLFKDNLSYVQPTYSEIIQNYIIDIGFWNKYWLLDKKMIDYDINPNEWNSS